MNLQENKLTVAQLKETLKLMKDSQPYHFKQYSQLLQLGTIPNNRMKKIDLLKHFNSLSIIFKQIQSEKALTKISFPSFDCPICMTSQNFGQYFCFDSRHVLCSACFDKQNTYHILTCPLCKQSRKNNLVIKCYQNDRPNFNRSHIQQLISDLNFDLPIQKIKWITFNILQTNNYTKIFIISDRFTKSCPLEINKTKLSLFDSRNKISQ